MEVARKIKKTRPQKKAFKVAIVASTLTLAFGVGVLVSALNYPVTKDVENLYENNELENVSRLSDNRYLLTSRVRDESGKLDTTYIYLYNNDNKLLQKVSIFDDVEEEFSITDLKTFDGIYAVEETDSLYVLSSNYLFHYSGLNENNLSLEGYTDSFEGRIIRVASNDTDLYVLSQIGSQYRVDRFLVGDETYDIKASGYIYNDKSGGGDNYRLECSKNMFIYSFDVSGDYLYLTTNSMIRRIHKNMINNNYRILFENEFNNVATSHPELSLDNPADREELNSITKENCLTNYGWLDYDYNVHMVTLSKSELNASNYALYKIPEIRGVVNYLDKYIYVDKSNQFLSYSIEELDDSPSVINYLDEYDLHLVDTLHSSIEVRSEVSVNAFCYYKIGKTCILFLEESSSYISIVDLDKEEIIYTVDVSTRIADAFYDEEKDVLVYKFQDPVNRKSGVNYLSTCVVGKMLTKKWIKPVLTIFIIFTVIALIAALTCWLSYFFKKIMTLVIQTGRGLRKHWMIYVILFPTILLLCLFCYYPGIAAMYTSLFDYQAGISDIKTWNNFGNYVQIFGNKESLMHFGNMILFLLADVVLAILPPLIFAYFLTLMRHKKVSGILRTLLFIPGIVPGIASLLIWRTGIYGDYGVVNTIIKASGGEPILFFRLDDYTNMLWLILMGFPFVGSYLIFYGAMMNIPSSYYEAAELDGISVFKRFVKIDIPLCFPQIKYVLIMTIIASIQNFSRVYITMGRTQNVVSTPIVEMYMLMNGSERNYGLASAYATVLFVILFGLTFLSMRNKFKER